MYMMVKGKYNSKAVVIYKDSNKTKLLELWNKNESYM